MKEDKNNIIEVSRYCHTLSSFIAFKYQIERSRDLFFLLYSSRLRSNRQYKTFELIDNQYVKILILYVVNY